MKHYVKRLNSIPTCLVPKGLPEDPAETWANLPNHVEQSQTV